MALLACSLACSPSLDGSDPEDAGSAAADVRDVLLVTIDTLRPDHLGLYGYDRPTSPNIDRYFADATIFERAYATSAHTSPSVVSLLSGLYPQQHRVRLFYQLIADELRLLPERLPDDFVSAGIVSNVVLTDEAIGLAGRFDYYDDFVDERESSRMVYERGARRTVDAALGWLERSGGDAERVFLWVHFIDPHGPYRPPAEWQDRFDHEGVRPIAPERVPAYQRDPGVSDGLHYVDRYDAEIAYLDAELGRLLTGWARSRGLERSLVIFTADHGESMMEHERWFTHGYHVYEEIIRVPLMVRAPGVRAQRIAEPVSGVDVLPTVLRALGLEPAPDMPGHDLLDSEGAPQDRVVLATGGSAGPASHGWLAGVMRDRKAVLAVDAKGRVRGSRVYQLDRDPGELRPMRPERHDTLVLGLRRIAVTDPDPGGVPIDAREGIALDAPKVRPDVSPAARERLRALGYAE